MPPRSKVETLPDEVRSLLDARLIQSGFSDYRGLSDWLGEQGYEIRKSALQNYGAQLEKKASRGRSAISVHLTINIDPTRMDLDEVLALVHKLKSLSN